jgi:AraC-like DNA-binding protein
LKEIMQTLSYALDTTWRTVLRDLGIRAADVLRRAGLPDDLFQQPSARLAPDDYYRLWGGLEAESGDPLLPLRLCQAFRSESFSPPLFAALCSPNLLVAAQRIAHYKRLVAPMRLDVSLSGGRAVLEFVWLDAPLSPPVSLVIMELLFCVSLARMGTREPIRPLEVATPALPVPPGPYEDYLGTRIKRGATHRVTFEKADATRPFLTSNEPLWAAFEPELRKRLADLDASVTMVKRVRAALNEAIPSGQVTMEAIAGRLALSKRTLQRRIEAEGTSYQQILKETRLSLAHHYLANTTLPAAEISFLLGFDEPNSFYRAFRAWTGDTPDRIRQSSRFGGHIQQRGG